MSYRNYGVDYAKVYMILFTLKVSDICKVFEKLCIQPKTLNLYIILMNELCDDKSIIFSKHMVTYRNKVTKLCIFYRRKCSTHGYNADNIVEAAIRVFKSIIIE